MHSTQYRAESVTVHCGGGSVNRTRVNAGNTPCKTRARLISSVLFSSLLYLVEFAQMSGVHGLVSEHTVDREVLLGLEASFLVRKLVQHLCADGCGVCAEQVLHGLFLLEHAAVSDGPEPTALVGLLHDLQSES